MPTLSLGCGELAALGVFALADLVDFDGIPVPCVRLPSADVRCTGPVEFSAVLADGDVVQTRLLCYLFCCVKALKHQLDHVRV